MQLVPVICPACHQEFGVPAPWPDELPALLDYDCEVCCRPMVIAIRDEDGEVFAEARGLDE